MGLQRYVGELRKQGSESPGDALYGMAFYHVADVDALIARIRAAVAAERAATVADTGSASGWVARITKYRAALDALLADGGA